MTRAAAVRRCRDALARGELALVPTDTVYGLAAALDDPRAVARLYAAKGRPRSQPCQVLVYDPALLERIVGGFPPSVAAVVRRLVPGTTTCIVPDPDGRFAEAAGDGAGSVGLRAPLMDPAFAAIDIPLVATSANDPGGVDPRRLDDVPGELRRDVGAEIDEGELPGVASAVVDLREPGRARLLRPGPDPVALTATIRALGLAVDG